MQSLSVHLSQNFYFNGFLHTKQVQVLNKWQKSTATLSTNYKITLYTIKIILQYINKFQRQKYFRNIFATLIVQQIFERFRRFTATHVAGVRVHAYVIPYGESKENKLLSAICDSNIYLFFVRVRTISTLWIWNFTAHQMYRVPWKLD